MLDTGAQRFRTGDLFGPPDDFVHREILAGRMLPVQQRRGDPGFIGDTQVLVHGSVFLPCGYTLDLVRRRH